jgi:hypothetical protein
MQAIDFIFETLAHYARQTEGPPPGVPAHISAQFERDLLRICTRQALAPIVLQSLERLALPPGLSNVTVERLKAITADAIRKNDRLFELAASLGTALKEAGIPHLIHQDASLAMVAHPNSDMRPMQQIHMLAGEDDWRTLVDVLASHKLTKSGRDPIFKKTTDALFYYQHFYPCELANGDGDRVRVRFRLFDTGTPEKHETSWSRRQSVRIGDSHLERLGDEDQLMQSCMELNMTQFAQLLHAVDIGLIIGRFGSRIDWDYIEERLSSRMLLPAFSLTLQQVARWLKLPDGPWVRYVPGRWKEKTFDIVWRTQRIRFGEIRVIRSRRIRFFLLESGRWIDKLLFLLRFVTPNPEWVAAFYGKPYRPWMRLQFIVTAIKSRTGGGIT